MTLNLAAPISAFFEATNRHDPDAVAACFTPNGLVHDENADHRSQAAIRQWADGTYRKYDVTLTPRDSRDDGRTSMVTAGVAGTFPGSPIELPFRFALDGDRIAELVIG
jgi:hypothetical protein